MDLGEAGSCVPTTPDELGSGVRPDGLVGGASAPEAGRALRVCTVDGVIIVAVDTEEAE